ncbi:MAG: ribosome biogenesis GTPase Der, partial [Rubripirellula sp.]
PPTIVLMCSDPRAFGNDYQRYLIGVMRDHLPFSEVPIKLYFEKSKGADDPDNPRSGSKR